MFQAWLVKMAKIAASSAPERVAGEEAEEERDGEGQEAQDRHRLEDVQDRDQHHLPAAALGRERRVGEGEDEREEQRREHAQRGAERVIGQVAVVERDHVFLRRRQRGRDAVVALRDRRQHRHDRRERDQVPLIRQDPPPGGGDAVEHGHSFPAPRSEKSRSPTRRAHTHCSHCRSNGKSARPPERVAGDRWPTDMTV